MRLVDGEVSDAQAAAFLMGLRAKGETADEIAGLAEALRRRAVRVTLPDSVRLVDIVGTGRRWPRHVQHLHDGRVRGGRSRGEGGQAR